MRPLLSLLLLAPAAALAGPVQDFDENVARGLVPHPSRQVVRAAPGVDVTAIRALAAEHDCTWDHQWGRHAWHTLECPADAPRQRLASLADDRRVAWVQVPFQAELLAAPDDLIDAQWHHRNTGQTIAGSAGTPGADIGSVDAWDVTTGGPGAVVAVIDSGVTTDHQELVGRIHRAPGETCGNGIDDDGNGYIDDCEGWDVGDGDNDPDPRTLPATTGTGRPCAAGHGTFIAGLIAAAGNNGSDGSGVLWNGRILPLKMVDDEDCVPFDTTLAEAVLYATDQGADVINASWAFGGTSDALDAAFAGAEAGDVVLVIAAGNSGQDIDARTTWPIDYHVAGDLVVAATDHRDALVGFSNTGAMDVDLAAPGNALWSLGITTTDDRTTGSGTSFAAPLVAGVAALVRERFPALSAVEVREAVLEGAEPVDGLDCGTSSRCVATGARLHAPGALAEAARLSTTPRLALAGVTFDDAAGDGDGLPERGESGALHLTFENVGHGLTDGAIATIAWTHPDSTLAPTTVVLGPLGEGDTEQVAADLSISLDCRFDEDALLIWQISDPVLGLDWSGDTFVSVRCDIDDDDDGHRYPEDCDDTDADVFPGADERCNDLDDDCDGTADEDAVDAPTWFPDDDGDGYGRDGEGVAACLPPEGFGEGTEDCDDEDEAVSPGADERCNGRDNDCDGSIDEDPVDGLALFVDADGDGFGGDPVEACPGEGLTDRPGDCDDADPDAWPGSPSWTEDCRRRSSCGCGTPAPGAPWLALLLPVLWVRRRYSPTQASS